jgi:hypothetical protein
MPEVTPPVTTHLPVYDTLDVLAWHWHRVFISFGTKFLALAFKLFTLWTLLDPYLNAVISINSSIDEQ